MRLVLAALLAALLAGAAAAQVETTRATVFAAASLTDAFPKIAPHARIVFMSGYAHDSIRQPAGHPFLAKPFTAESLTHVVRHAMTRAS